MSLLKQPIRFVFAGRDTKTDIKLDATAISHGPHEALQQVVWFG